MSGLLIVNADDWGGSEATTDAILATFEAGRITSTSSMVYMPDSERAAELARRSGLPVGLHLNLTEPFSGEAPPAVAARQRRLAERFAAYGPDGHPGTARLRKWLYDPTIAAEVRRAIGDQIERFEVLYGRPPTHFDGHNYVDTCPNVFLSRAIPTGRRMRASLGCYPLERSAMGVLKAARQRLRSWRFRSPRYLLDFADLLSSEGKPEYAPLDLARRAPLEVMTHPDHPREHTALMASAWEQALAGQRLGSYADL